MLQFSSGMLFAKKMSTMIFPTRKQQDQKSPRSFPAKNKFTFLALKCHLVSRLCGSLDRIVRILEFRPESRLESNRIFLKRLAIVFNALLEQF